MTGIVGVMPAPPVVGYVQPHHKNRNSERIKKDEEELEALIKAAQGETVEDEPPVETKPKAVEPPPAAKEEDEPLTAEEKSYKKRYGDLRSHANKLQDRIKALEEAATKAPASVRPPKSEEEIEAWMNKYPDVAAIVEAIADKKATEKFSGAQDRLAQLDSLAADAQRTKAEAEIRAFHPDFDELREKDEFHNWADEQPKWIKDALYENEDDPASVVKVISLYKMEKGIDTKGKKEAARAAVAPVVTKRTKPDFDVEGGGIQFKESQVNKMNVHEYEKNQDAIMEAIRTGRFIYDISGGAR